MNDEYVVSLFFSEFCEHTCTPLVYQLPALVARTNLSFVECTVVYISMGA